jgi:putative methionine-R-sulfoxide reductase with GAF domain
VVAVGEGTAGIAFQTGEPVVVEDYLNWEHAIKESIARGLRSVVAIPLLVKARPMGALTVSFNTHRQFKSEDLACCRCSQPKWHPHSNPRGCTLRWFS